MIPACLYGAFIPRPAATQKTQKPLPEGLCSARTGTEYGAFQGSGGSVVSTIGALRPPATDSRTRTGTPYLLDFETGPYAFVRDIDMLWRRNGVSFFLIQSRETNQLFFVKRTPARNIGEITLQQQAASLSKAVVPIDDYFIERDKEHGIVTTLVYPYMTNGDLFTHLHRKRLSTGEIAEKFKPLVHALAIMHENHITHRDIKPENILIDDEGCFHLTDFGLSKQLTEEERYTRTPVGTSIYADPHIYDGSYDPKKADVWSLGCTLYSSYTRSEIKEKRKATTERHIEHCLEEIADVDFRDLLENMLRLNPLERFDMAQVYEHRFFTR